MCARRSACDGGGPSKVITAPMCMCDPRFSWSRNDTSIGLSRSMCVWVTAASLVAIRASVTLRGEERDG